MDKKTFYEALTIGSAVIYLFNPELFLVLGWTLIITGYKWYEHSQYDKMISECANDAMEIVRIRNRKKLIEDGWKAPK